MKNYLKLIVSEKALEAFKPEEKIMLNLVLNVGFEGLTNDYCPSENTKETIELVNSVLANFRKLTDEETLTVSAETGLPVETLEAIKRHMEAEKKLKEEEVKCCVKVHGVSLPDEVLQNLKKWSTTNPTGEEVKLTCDQSYTDFSMTQNYCHQD